MVASARAVLALLPLLLLLVPVLQLAADGAPAAAALELHVDPSHGPFYSVASARDHLRTLRDAAGRLPAGGARVLLHGGTHAPFVLDPLLDSGSAGSPVVYAAFGDGPAVVSGGVELPASAFTAAAGKPGQYEVDLAKFGLGPADFGYAHTLTPPSLCLPACLPACLSACLSLTYCLYFCLYLCLCLCLCLSVWLSVCL